MKTRSFLMCSLLVVGCGGEDENLPDARVGGLDAAAVDAALPDATPTIDAVMVDATVSSVIVTPNCTGIDNGQIAVNLSTGGLSFDITAPNLVVGEILRFSTTGMHNFASDATVAPANAWKSGPVGSHTACLQFTAAGTFGFRCDQHASMTGTLTVSN